MNRYRESEVPVWVPVWVIFAVLAVGLAVGAFLIADDKQKNPERYEDTDRTEIIMHSIRMENDMVNLERRIERLEEEGRDDRPESGVE